MELQLIGVTNGTPPYSPSDLVTATARSCYSPTPILPTQVSNWPRKKELLKGLFEGGHHTTFIHPHFTFLIKGVSRLLIWRLLHSHPFYNSEQVSQRYAPVSPESFYYPKGGNRKRWEEFYRRLHRGYLQLKELLQPLILKMLPDYRRNPREAEKRAQEFARYLLPLGTTAHLYHTISLVTILRYLGGVKGLPEAREEGREFAQLLKRQLLEMDPELGPIVEEAEGAPVEFPTLQWQEWKRKEWIGSNRGRLGVDPSWVQLLHLHYFPFKVGVNRAEVLRFNTLYPDWGEVGYASFYLKLSLSADAQNQRHRRTAGVRPRLEELYSGPDYYTPPVLADLPEAYRLYQQLVESAYDFFEEERDKLGFGEASYALLNCHLIEIVEGGDLGSYHHKLQMRLCLNAQEEIFWLAKHQMVELVRWEVPDRLFGAPCQVRRWLGVKPYCPEGERYCGVPVWRLSPEEIHREI